MTQTQTSSLSWDPPSSSRRRFFRILGGLTALNVLMGRALRARPQTSREIEGVNSWTKQARGFSPPNGFVPDTKTALKVAEAILTAVYGEQQIAKEQPLKVALVDKEVWMVWGTLDKRYLGGTAVVKISKKTGTVVFLSHGQ